MERLRDAIPDLAIGTDLIVGFPGETDQDFEQTLAAVEQVGYDSAFTFIYSPRQGTEAADAAIRFPRRSSTRGSSGWSLSCSGSRPNATQSVSAGRGGARRGAEPDRLVALRGRTRRNTTVIFTGDAGPGDSSTS